MSHKARDLILLAEADPSTSMIRAYQAPPDYIRWRNEDVLDDVAKTVIGRPLKRGRRKSFIKIPFKQGKMYPGELDSIDTVASLSYIINTVEHALESENVQRRYVRGADDEEDNPDNSLFPVFVSIAKALGSDGSDIVKEISSQDTSEHRTILLGIKYHLQEKLGKDYLRYKSISEFERLARKNVAKSFGSFSGTERDITNFIKKWRASRSRTRARKRDYDINKTWVRKPYKYTDK